MFICICRKISDSEISKAVGGGCNTIEKLQCATQLGTQCGKCIDKAHGVITRSIKSQRLDIQRLDH